MSSDSSLSFGTGVQKCCLNEDMSLFISRRSQSLAILILIRQVVLLEFVEELPMLITGWER